jgi:hypothetical protein
MALSVSITKYLMRGWPGKSPHKWAIATITTDDSYAAGGYAVSGATIGTGWSAVDGIVPLGPVPSADVQYTCSWDEANNKLMVIGTDDGAEAGDAEAELDGLEFTCWVIGS